MKLFERLWAKIRKPEPEEVEMPKQRGAVHETKIEKFVFTNGDEVLIYNPRVRHYMDGKIASGYRCADDGFVTDKLRQVDLTTVVRRVAMGWDSTNAEIVEAPEFPLPSEVQ